MPEEGYLRCDLKCYKMRFPVYAQIYEAHILAIQDHFNGIWWSGDDLDGTLGRWLPKNFAHLQELTSTFSWTSTTGVHALHVYHHDTECAGEEEYQDYDGRRRRGGGGGGGG
jgi:hypothetical protein